MQCKWFLKFQRMFVSASTLLDPEDEGIMFVKNVGNCSPCDTVSHCRRLNSWGISPWEPQISLCSAILWLIRHSDCHFDFFMPLEINKQAKYDVKLFVRFGVPRPVTEEHTQCAGMWWCVVWLKFTDINKKLLLPSSGWEMLEVGGSSRIVVTF